MKIYFNKNNINYNLKNINICFNEEIILFNKVNKNYDIDPEVKVFIENNFDYIVTLWNRFIRYKSMKLDDLFYYSSPIVSGMGYPPRSIVSLGIILYIKKRQKSYMVLHTNRSELIAYYTKSYFRLFSIKELVSTFFSIFFLTSFLLSKYIFRSIDKIKPAIIIHSHHHKYNFNKDYYRTSKVPDLSHTTSNNGFNLYYDINPSTFSILDIFKFRKYNCIFSPSQLDIRTVLRVYFQSAVFWYKNLILFKSFFFSETNIYNGIFFNIIKRKSISCVISNIHKKSYYIMNWENRGYQLGVEKDMNGEKIIQYSSGILSKVGTEYCNYRYIKHKNFAINITMSKYVKGFLSKLNRNRDYSIIVKSSRVSKTQNTNIQNTNKLIICPIDKQITKELLKLFHNDANAIFKFHPYCVLNIDKSRIEKRTLSECLKDYTIAITDGLNTSSILELLLAGIKVYRVNNQNSILSDYLDGFQLNLEGNLISIKLPINKEYMSEGLKNYYIGVNEMTFNHFLSNIINQNL
jgi:hypothetical protein